MSKPVKERKSRPVNLDLQTIHFPISAIASIVHRISGVITFIAIGILLWLLSISLSSPQGFDQASALVGHVLVKFVLWGILTALAYHIAGGIRHLLMDLGHFEELESGAQSAKVVFGATVVLSLLGGILVW
ncbi:succinate dehydrogenase cytochrome b556 subunit [Vibrio sp. SM6]|uniref:Succinate dehydrogenase cytochrome b556 subunit n=1 Tax=Vibrio agarilyticus TaxID=2726741 RepID=A0A7X8TN17_9VIBR|nr:succinate dehydrogenase cytochrome b556 subunit [Vibrio agarilyticus]